MDLQERIGAEMRKRMEGLLVFAVLLGFGFFINRDVELTGLYMDDLYLWSCYGEQSFREYVFPVGGTRFRFVFYLASWLELFFLGNHVEWMVPFNILLNVLIAFSMYRISLCFSKGRKAVGLAVGILYLLSRMAYYQIGQFYGLMESLALWAALGILYFLYRYGNGRDTKSYLTANLLYFLASFIHERYMVLFPVLLLALAMGAPAEERAAEREREPGRSRSRSVSYFPKWGLLLGSLGVFGLIQVIRLCTIGTLSPAGTGGTDVADTFRLGDAIGHAFEQAAFVFGRNSGPDYLCVLPFDETPGNIRLLIYLSQAVLGAAVLLALAGMVREKGRLAVHGKNLALFLAFIALCIGSSSVTIRVEMRWVYVAYGAALLLLSYLSSVLGRAGVLVFLYGALVFPVEGFYRDNWENLYLWPPQLRYNSLAEETIGAYGEEIFDKDIYIIGNTYEMSEFTAETFLKVYDKENRESVPAFRFIDSDFDLKEITGDMVILAEEPERNAYEDVTEFVKKQRWNLAYGSYEDGWVDENAKLVFLNGDRDTVVLSCYYPGTITGDQVCRIRVNGKEMPELVFTDNTMTYEFPAAPYQRISLELSCNFYVEDAKEVRGEERLAMIVGINGEK